MKKLWTLAILALMGLGSVNGQSALNFDGTNDFVLGTNNPSLDITEGTLEAWIKTSDAGDFYRGIIVKHGSYGVYLLDNILVAYQWSGNLFFSTGVNLADNNWHHVAFVFQNGVVNGSKLYIDGLPVLTFTYNLVINTSSFIDVGAGHYRVSPPSQNFNGTIDQVRVWNTVRTDAEILGNYQQCLSGEEDGLVMLWNFEEGTGSSVSDFSGNDNNGVLTNMDAGNAWVVGYNCNSTPNSINSAEAIEGCFIAGKVMYLNLSGKEDSVASVMVYNSSGQIVLNDNAFTGPVSLEGLKNGVYILRIAKTDGSQQSMKFLITE